MAMCFVGKWMLLMVSTVAVLLHLPSVSHGRAVNISNTWTLPQEGYPVFYRFFRDKISWFEADAVCQFHHANLVTVENGVQFDAARAFLKELDVTEFVWIGLMRQQDSPHFVWSSSKPLDPSSGYWADPFPVMDSPLCAVIDPIRDYRWHALRCGGPETAAFLCEMEVPAWATECTVSAMPSLTVQYMSDSGTVELSRDCGEEGTRHIPCRGQTGVERDSMLNELRCIDETPDTPVASTIPPPTVAATTTMQTTTSAARTTTAIPVQTPSTDPLTSIQTDNMEDNTIPNQTVSSTSTGFDDVMLADQPAKVAKPEPGRMKKVLPKDKLGKKEFNVKKTKKMDSSAEMMMGDQPYGEEHIPEMVLQHEEKSVKGGELHFEVATTARVVSTSTTPQTTTEEHSTVPSTTESRQRRQTVGHESTASEWTTSSGLVDQTSTIVPPSSSTAGSTLFDIPLTTEQPHKVTVNESVDHFIPPMLLVRTKFTSSVLPSTPHPLAVSEETTAPSTTVTLEESSDSTTSVTQSSEEATIFTNPTTSPEVLSTEHDATNDHDSTTTSPTLIVSTTTTTPDRTTAPHSDATSTIGHPRFHPPHAPQRIPDAPVEHRPKITPSKDNPNHLASHLPHHIGQISLPSGDTSTLLYITTTEASPKPTTIDPTPDQTTEGSGGEESTAPSASPSELVKQSGETSAETGSSEQRTVDPVDAAAGSTAVVPTRKYGDLTNKENLQAYRPNRSRMLYKVEKHTYLKKLFG